MHLRISNTMLNANYITIKLGGKRTISLFQGIKVSSKHPTIHKGTDKHMIAIKKCIICRTHYHMHLKMPLVAISQHNVDTDLRARKE